MNKAFIFDMDGVLVNSEQTWHTYESDFLSKLMGEKIAAKIGDTIGMSLNTIYENATSYGFKMNKQEFYDLFDLQASQVYAKSQITEGVDELGEQLLNQGFKLGLVTSSPLTWINHVLPRIKFSKHLECIISINNRPDLKPKPYPDSYIEAIKTLHALPKTTFILEDSNTGIEAGKASGAFVIGLKQNLVPGYTQKGADRYVDHVQDVLNITRTIRI